MRFTGLVISPFRQLRRSPDGIVDTIGTMMGNETVLAMWHKTTDLSDRELASLGFRQIAGSELVYRHSALKSEFSDKHPLGMGVSPDFEAEESDEEWVLRRWTKPADDPTTGGC